MAAGRLAFPLAVVTALLASAACADAAERLAASGDWPQWRGPNRSGISSETGLLQDWNQQKPELLWTAEGLGGGYASVSVAGGKIFTTGNLEEGQSVTAIDARDGKLLWSTTLTAAPPKHGYEGSRSTPTVDGDRLYLVTSDGSLVCLSAADGQVVWQKSFKDEWKGRMMSGWGFSESPLVDGDKVVCTPGGPDAMLVAVDKLDGREIWRSAVPDFGKGKGAGYSSIVISEGAGVRQYVQLVGQGVIGVRADDGKFLWGYAGVANGTANIPTPIVSGNYVFASTGYNTGSALLELSRDGDGVKAEQKYFLDAKTLQNKHGGMVLVKDHVYCGHGNGTGLPICVELATGKIAWGGNERGPGRGEAAVVYADGHIIYRFQDGVVALVEATPEEYRLKGSFTPAYQEGKSWAHPVVAGGRLYLREQNKLMCYDLRRQ